MENIEGKTRYRRYQTASPMSSSSGRDFSWTEGSDSIYLWDAGLWTACKESRQIVMSYFRVEHWNNTRRSLSHSKRYWTSAALAEEFEAITAIIVARHDGEEWHLMVQPHKDLFCLEPSDWRTVDDWQAHFCDLTLSPFRKGYGHIGHVAVEFDQSWNRDIPNDLCDILKEWTPRGFIARVMAECAENRLHSFFWLIDRHASWSTPGSHHVSFPKPMVFYDCKHKYIETNQGDLEGGKDDETQFERTAVYFVQQLGSVANKDYTRMGGQNGLPIDGHDFRVDECLGVLTCM
ncbi:hypothetical protein HIM_10893 [Hirsutella minnesotensis 3608]|uniref:Uncharacterized protein n=1 Tax=Hirsutella minnesotensis 3608 TaxID=1043627 RepID=A0A0F8A1U7_9HYPO|nr:hypothetical protein HIM_10893 [Hirsutella minnesotensis 3608]